MIGDIQLLKKDVLDCLNQVEYFSDPSNNKEYREEIIVHSIIRHLVDFLCTNGCNYFAQNNLELKAGGVLIHATPKVKPATTPSPFPDKSKISVEIGDLLLIINFYKVTSNNKKELSQKRALMFQVKKDSKIDNNINQLYLYTKWPEFEYVHQKNLTGSRNLNIKSISSGTKYLLLDPQVDQSKSCNFIDHLSKVKINTSNFADLFVDFLSGHAGLSYKSSNDWHNVVQELWELTKDKTINTIKRGCGNINFLLGNFDENLKLTRFSNDARIKNASENISNEIGINTIRISITANKDN